MSELEIKILYSLFKLDSQIEELSPNEINEVIINANSSHNSISEIEGWREKLLELFYNCLRKSPKIYEWPKISFSYKLLPLLIVNGILFNPVATLNKLSSLKFDLLNEKQKKWANAGIYCLENSPKKKIIDFDDELNQLLLYISFIKSIRESKSI